MWKRCGKIREGCDFCLNRRKPGKRRKISHRQSTEKRTRTGFWKRGNPRTPRAQTGHFGCFNRVYYYYCGYRYIYILFISFAKEEALLRTPKGCTSSLFSFHSSLFTILFKKDTKGRGVPPLRASGGPKDPLRRTLWGIPSLTADGLYSGKSDAHSRARHGELQRNDNDNPRGRF